MRPPASPDAITCPRCGGTPDPEGGPGFLARCGECGVLGRIDDPAAGGPALAVLPAVTAGALPEVLAREFHERGESSPVLETSELVFVPFWRVESVLVGRVAGERHRREHVVQREFDEDGAPVFARKLVDEGVEKVEKEVQRVHVALISACPLDELGIPTLDHQRQMPGRLSVGQRLDRLGAVVVFEPRLRTLGSVLDPLVDRDRALREAAEVLKAARSGLTGDMLPGAVEETEVLCQDTCLVHHPVHVCRIAVGDRRGSAVVDGVSGQVVAALLPPEPVETLEHALLGGAALVAGWIAASLARLAVFPPPEFTSSDAAGLRVDLLGGALLLAAAAAAGLVRVARRMERAR